MYEIPKVREDPPGVNLSRFGGIHPIHHEEIQELLGPYLDIASLLQMRLATRSCKYFAEEELSRRQRLLLQENRWSSQQFKELTSFHKIIQTSGAHFSSLTPPIQDFIGTFGNSGESEHEAEADVLRWPFFGEGLVRFHSSLDTSSYEAAVTFAEKFGELVAVLIWEIKVSKDNLLKSILSHTPNLRDLWLVEWKHTSKKKDSIGVLPWPPLPCLQSLHFGLQYSIKPLQVYSSTLTSLEVTSILEIPPQLVDNPEMLPLDKLDSLKLNMRSFHLAPFMQHSNFSALKRLSIDVWMDTIFSTVYDRYDPPESVFNDSNFLWKLINQTSQNLEEIYFQFHGQWQTCVKMLSLPGFYKPDITEISGKVKKMSIPIVILFSPQRVLDFLWAKFPNVEHIHFIEWEGDLVDELHAVVTEVRQKWAGYLPDPEEYLDLLFYELRYTVTPVELDVPPETLFSKLWDELHCLKKVTAAHYNGHEVYKEIRK